MKSLSEELPLSAARPRNRRAWSRRRRLARRRPVFHAVLAVTIALGTPACADPAAEMEDPPEEGDPTAEVDAAWTEQAPLPGARTEVSAAAHEGRVYLIGGFDGEATTDDERPPAASEMYVYDPPADEWSGAGPIPEGVHHAGFVALDGRLYIVGGYRDNTFDPTGAVRIYDIEEDTWSDGSPMPTPRGALAVAVVDGRIHAIGGTVADSGVLEGRDEEMGPEDESVTTHEVYDPAADRWERLAPMSTARNHIGAAAVDGRIHVVAGRAGEEYEMTVHEIYDPGADSWSEGAPVPTGRSGVAFVELGGAMYLFGGETFADPSRTFDEAERYDPEEDRWRSLPPMPTARHGLGAAVLDGAIHVISGGPQPGFHYGTANERLDP